MTAITAMLDSALQPTAAVDLVDDRQDRVVEVRIASQQVDWPAGYLILRNRLPAHMKYAHKAIDLIAFHLHSQQGSTLAEHQSNRLPGGGMV